MTDTLATHFPVSVKGVVRHEGLFVLLRNERDEWELPGGKLEAGEAIDDCLIREVKEELNLRTGIVRPLNNWVYFVNGIHVVIITYELDILVKSPRLEVSHENKELRLFPPQEIGKLRMPHGYQRSIEMCADASR